MVGRVTPQVESPSPIRASDIVQKHFRGYYDDVMSAVKCVKGYIPSPSTITSGSGGGFYSGQKDMIRETL